MMPPPQDEYSFGEPPPVALELAENEELEVVAVAVRRGGQGLRQGRDIRNLDLGRPAGDKRVDDQKK